MLVVCNACSFNSTSSSILMLWGLVTMADLHRSQHTVALVKVAVIIFESVQRTSRWGVSKTCVFCPTIQITRWLKKSERRIFKNCRRGQHKSTPNLSVWLHQLTRLNIQIFRTGLMTICVWIPNPSGLVAIHERKDLIEQPTTTHSLSGCQHRDCRGDHHPVISWFR